MSQIITPVFYPEYYQYIVTQAFNGVNLRLGVILNGSETTSTDRADAIAAEYNGSGWTRPTITLPSLGSYDATNQQWDLPDVLAWTVTGPTGGFAIKQLFVIIGGSATPRNTSGIAIAPYMLTTPITVPASASTTISAPWILGTF